MSGSRLAFTGEYITSRFPGYPLSEFIFAAAVSLGLHNVTPYIFNIITLLFSISAVVILYKLLQHTGHEQPVIPALIFCFTPLFLINSSVPMDYNFSLFFLLSAVYLAYNNNFLISGLLIGFAIASRPAALIFIPSFLLYIYISESKRKTATSVLFLAASILPVLLFYAPLYSRYGFKFLQAYAVPYPSILNLAGRGSIRVWGIPGFITMILLTITYISKFELSSIEIFNPNKKYYLLPTAIIISTLLQFFIVPNESGYLLPAIPFTIMLLFSYIPRKGQIIMLLAMFLSIFLTDIKNESFMIPGPVVNNYFSCKEDMQRVEKINLFLSADSGKTRALIAGNSAVKIQLYNSIFLNNSSANKNIFGVVDMGRAKQISSGYNVVYFLPEAIGEIKDDYNYNLPETIPALPIPGL